MKMPSRNYLPISAACFLTLTCGGCASLGTNGAAPIARAIPAACEGLDTRRPLPALKKGQEARVALAEHRAALVRADAEKQAMRACMAAVREQFATQ